MIYVTVDFETISSADLLSVGSTRYSEDPTTQVLCLHLRCKGRKIKWHPGEPIEPLVKLAKDPNVIWDAHNAGFEKDIWRNVMMPDYGLPDIPNERWDCTLATCSYKSIPKALDEAARVMNLPVEKDKEGRSLTVSLSKMGRKGFLPAITPEVMGRVDAYCERDCETEEELRAHIGVLPPAERKVWLHDQQVNERGIKLDLTLARQALKAIEQARIPLLEEHAKLTGGLAPTQREKVLAWLQSRGVTLPNLQKETIAEALGVDPEDEDPDSSKLIAEMNMPTDAYRVLEIRYLLNATSISKLETMIACACRDGRARRMFLYHGTSPGRTTSQILQVQNFPRGTIKDPETRKSPDPDKLVSAIMTGSADHISRTFGPVIETVSSALRHCIVAEEGKRLMAGDYSGIQARVVLALAGQHDKTAIMAAGQDVYCDMASAIFKRTVTKDRDPEARQLGKNCFSAGTKVLTQRGFIPIVDVGTDDLLWDGIEWVRHGGLVCRGHRDTVRMMGVSVTPEHPILCGETWVPAITVVQSAVDQSRALVTGSRNLPSPGSGLAYVGALSQLSCSALVAPPNTKSMDTIWTRENRRDATHALNEKRGTGESIIEDTPAFAPMTRIGHACLIVSPHASIDARTQTIGIGTTTAGEGFSSTRHGSKTAQNSLPTLSPCQDGTTLHSSLIEPTLTAGTSRGTSGSSPGKPIPLTSAKSQRCKSGLPTSKVVYDLVNAGPRHRFTILSSRGPIIVHNSVLGLGFGMGAAKFHVKYGRDQSLEFMTEVVRVYRKEWAPKVPKLWYALMEAASAAVHTRRPQEAYGIVYCLEDRWLSAKLPSGRKIWYFDPQPTREAVPWDENDIRWGFTYRAKKMGVMRTIRAFGGLLAENVVMGIERDCMTEGKFALEAAGFPVIMDVHDEVICEVDPSCDVAAFEAAMLAASKVPWVQKLRIPLAVETWKAPLTRYRK